MNDPSTAQTIAIVGALASLLGPVSVGLLGSWLRKSVEKIEKISTILIELQHLKTRQNEMKVQLQNLNQTFNSLNNEFILTKNEVKTQWSRLDEVRSELKDKRFK